MNWNKKDLVLEDGLSFDILDTVDSLTCAVTFCFTDSPFSRKSDRWTEMAERLAEKHVAVLVFAHPEAFIHKTRMGDEDFPDPEDTVLMKRIIDGLCTMYQKYKFWLLCYAEGYAAILNYVDLRDRYNDWWKNFDLNNRNPLLFLQCCLAMEIPLSERDELENYRYVMPEIYVPAFANGQENRIKFYSGCDRVPFISEEETIENICGRFFHALRYVKMQVWDFMMQELKKKRYYDLDDDEAKAYIEYLISMTQDFEGCGAAAAQLYHTLKGAEPGITTEGAAKWIREFFGERAKPWPDDLLWLVRAADCGHTFSRIELYDHLREGASVRDLIPYLESEIADGHSYAAILAGVAAEGGRIREDRESDLHLAKHFYRQAATLGDYEGWYRLGRIAEYSENHEEEAWENYKNATKYDFLPAWMKYAQHLEDHPEDQHDESELYDTYEKINEIVQLGFVQMKMARLKEKDEWYQEAANLYVSAIYCGSSDKIEKSWRYNVENDWMYGVILLDSGDDEFEDEAYFHLGKILMENPSIDFYPSKEFMPVPCFENVVYRITDRIKSWEEGDPEPVFSADDAISEHTAMALYYIGLCKLQGIDKSDSLKRTFLYFKAASFFGSKEALPYTEFFEEAEAFLEEAARISPDGRATEEMRRREAGYRLQLLGMMGLDDTLKEDYLRLGIVYKLYDAEGGYCKLEEEDQEIISEISKMEQQHNASVYLVLESGSVYRTVALFYVSPRIDEWSFERKQIASCEPYVYVFGTGPDKDQVFTDIGPIGITIDDEVMSWKW